MLDHTPALLPSEDFCTVRDPRGLASRADVPEEAELSHWHEDAVGHGERWRGWRLCVLAVCLEHDEQGRHHYQVLTQAARAPDIDVVVRQEPVWPDPEPEWIRLEARISLHGATAGHYWDEARALFGLPRSGPPASQPH